MIGVPLLAFVAIGLIVYASRLGDEAAATLEAAPPPVRLRVAGDPSSGYSTFRKEPRLTSALLEDHVELEYLDDERYYAPSERVRALSVATLDVAVMTLDAFLQFGARYPKTGHYPGSILFAIDESSGADAIFMGKRRSNFDDVRPGDEVCFTPGTPSEHLWDFASLSFAALRSGLVEEKVAVAKDCWEKLQADRVELAVLSQPYTALAVKAGYPKVFATGGPADDLILDVAVAGRDALAQKGDALRRFVSAYFRTVDAQVKDPSAHAAFVTTDCGRDCASDAALGAAVLESIDFLTLEENACVWFGLCGGSNKLVERVDMTRQLLVTKGKMDARALPTPASLFDASFLKTLNDERLRAPLVAVGASNAEREPRQEPTAKERVYTYTAAAAATGSPVGTLELPNIAFAEASHAINEEARGKIGVIAEALRGFPALCVRIVGHTNSTGDEEANRLLSKARALAIAEELTAIDPSVFPNERFDVHGMGSERPVLVNGVEDKRASRRTEFTLIDCGH